MPPNLLLTGPPRIGKSTVVARTLDRLGDPDVGGLRSPERRVEGERVGFDLVDIHTGDRATLARIDDVDSLAAVDDLDGTAGIEGPTVGRYRVDVAAVDRLAGEALPRAREECGLAVVDEIGPMQTHSDVFVRETRRTLDADRPVLGVVQAEATTGFIGAVKTRADVELIEVTRSSRDRLPPTLAQRLGVGG